MINVTISSYHLGQIPAAKEDPRAFFQQFSALWPIAPTNEPDFEKENRWTWVIPEGPARLTEEEATALMALGVELKLVPLPGAMVVKMQDRFKWESQIDPNHEHIRTGAAVQLAIPDLGLMTITEVVVREDYCTDMLQSDLDEGWRILAVCPPNAARRPDYILGRTKK